MNTQKLSKKDVEHIAGLAKLSLSTEELEKFGAQLGTIFSYFQKIAELDTKSIEPTSQVNGLENITRDDEVIEEQTVGTSAALAGTKNKYNDLFKVSAIFEGDSHES